MNDKVIKSLIAIIGFVVGGAVGIYKTTLDYESEVKTLKAEIRIQEKLLDEKVKDAADDVYRDVETLIQERILTTFYTRLKNEFLTKPKGD